MAQRHSRARFFNQQLRAAVYNHCPLPTKTPFPGAQHATLEDAYARRLGPPDAAFQHTCYTPPAPPPAPPSSLPFRDFRPPDIAVAPAANSGAGSKRKKTPVTNGQKRRAKDEDGVCFRSYKVRLLPTAEQFDEFMRTFRVVADIYNWANTMVKGHGARANHFDLRKLFNASRSDGSDGGDNTSDGGPSPHAIPPVDIHSRAPGAPVTPIHATIRSYAIKELVEAHKKDAAHPERIGERRMDLRDDRPTATFTLEKYFAANQGLIRFEAVRDAQRRRTPAPRRRGRGSDEHRLKECDLFLGGNFRRLGAIRMQDKARVIDALVNEEGARLRENGKILWDKRTGALYFIYLRAVPKLSDPDPDFATKRVVATDPGCTPFQAWYSPTSGCHGEVLAGMGDQIRARRKAITALEKRIKRRTLAKCGDTYPTSRRRRRLTPAQRALRRQGTTRRLRRRLARERLRFSGWIAAAHYDAAHALLRDHDLVVQPKLPVARLIQQTDIAAYKQRLRDWGHYRFRQRLASASARYAGRHVLETTEPGTSKTCTHCGFWKEDLGVADKTFECPRCGLCVDRQLAGARNNFLAAYGMAVDIGWDGVVVVVGVAG